MATLKGHAGAVTCLYASYHANHLLSGSSDFTVRLWDYGEGSRNDLNGNALRIFKGHSGPISAVKQLGRQSAVSASADRTVQFWDKRMRKAVAILKGHTGPVTFFQDGGPDGTLLITGSADCTVRIWDMRRAAKGAAHVCRGHMGRVTALLRKKTRVLSAGADGFLCEWDLASGALVCAHAGGHAQGISFLAVAHDSAAVVSAGLDGRCRLWPTLHHRATGAGAT